MIFFSIILPIYKKNKISEVVNCLNSVVNKSLLPNEIVIIYDGFVNSSIKDIVNNKLFFFNKKIVHNSTNIGLGLTLKKGVMNCSNDLIIRVDADDVNNKNRFYELIKAAKKNKKADIIGSYLLEKNNNNYYLKKVPISLSEVKRLIFYRNPLNHNTILLKKRSIIKVGSYRDIRFFEDYYLWLKIIKNNGKIINLNKVLVCSKQDKAFLERRSGYKYLKYFLNFLKIIYRERLINITNYVLYIAIRSPIIISPLLFKRLFYQVFLRKKI